MLFQMPRVLAVLLFVAAAFGGFIAWITHGVLCGEGTSPMCFEGNATTTMTLQLVVGLLGVAIAGAMLYFAFQGKRHASRWALAAGLLTFAVWAVLNDATVHGWDRSMRFW